MWVRTGSGNGEQDGEDVGREAHGLVDQTAVEIDVGVQLPARMNASPKFEAMSTNWVSAGVAS